MLELVKARSLSKTFENRHQTVHALNDVDLTVCEGECVAIVGESGCGKSTLARILVGLEQPTHGEASIGGLPVASPRPDVRRRIARLCQMVFQDPYASLNPRMRIGSIIDEPLRIHHAGDADRRKRRVFQLLETVHLPPDCVDQYPHQLSGGQRQRVGIARALALSPKVLIADEPVSALDVSIQAQILNLLNDLKRSLSLTLILVSHDLQVVRWISNRVVVMYHGRIVESGATKTIFENPVHPYTRVLLNAAPRIGVPPQIADNPIPHGDSSFDSGCAFGARCPLVQSHCKSAVPILDGRVHRVACFEAPSTH
ncbi:MAG: oligopeptide/dipeptide ABC transporter ATP-binding protein [Myxococcota bacterium]|nr:oligopeptide/dipeptide ABC transporter ATP-binding protein [Myxococcota bacterium]